MSTLTQKYPTPLATIDVTDYFYVETSDGAAGGRLSLEAFKNDILDEGILPVGVEGGSGGPNDALLKMTIQSPSGEFRSLKNVNGDEVLNENTDGNEQVQWILKDKTGPVMVGFTPDQGALFGFYGSAPPTPGANLITFWPNASGRPLVKDPSGNEVWLSADYDHVTLVSSTPYTVLPTDRTIICLAGSDVLNLPAAADSKKRREITNYSGSDITVNRNGADTIRKGTTTGGTSITVADGDTVSIRSITIGSDALDVIGVYS